MLTIGWATRGTGGELAWPPAPGTCARVGWAKKHLGDAIYKRLIFSHNKHLNEGHFLIDDRPHRNGAGDFKGELIHFGSDKFPNWDHVLGYLLNVD